MICKLCGEKVDEFECSLLIVLREGVVIKFEGE